MQISHEAERHLSQSRKEDDDDEDDDKGSSKDGKAKTIFKLKKVSSCYFLRILIKGNVSKNPEMDSSAFQKIFVLNACNNVECSTGVIFWTHAQTNSLIVNL